jgi:sugar lactone lactonase YvrE
LYVTTARAPLDTAARESQHGAGGLFRARPGVVGLPAALFHG